MKLELKTENDKHTKWLSNFFRVSFTFALIIIFCDTVLKLGVISRHYQIEYNCSLLSVETSQSNFRELSKLSKLKSKQKIWEFCREFIE
ncbi:hypothetical protein CU311_05145 [Prochlorococcus marinus str. MU1402]|uniref:hypothetical protein n=1 Tax=Prochlorococcus marinus TaxID=1219 RepID=UPI001ADBD364|nr:hypothetical protein [Prochlorococcus marinus]MBO8232056.1 hypothetical protein [Prochlorococcus marinus XMU1402]MBW3056793.1 hypothetical protein [Prochlorococcus marinus str. MU1402]